MILSAKLIVSIAFFFLGLFLFIMKKSEKAFYIIVFSIFFFFCYTGFVVKQRFFNDKASGFIVVIPVLKKIGDKSVK